jgi:ABC-type bacteriocin/lantibiotic exporter with double-glycine peptidase domain
MENSTIYSKNNKFVEFSPEKDKFEKVRQKGPVRWIIAHFLYGSNKIIIFIVLFSTVFAAILGSATRFIIGEAVNEFVLGNNTTLFNYVMLIFLLGTGAPLIILFNFFLR